MDDLQKFERIVEWFSDNTSEDVAQLVLRDKGTDISKIEGFLESPIPKGVKDIFEKYDGDGGEGYGAFIGHSPIGIDEAISELESAQERIKPENPYIADPEQSESLINELNAIYRSLIPEDKKPWYKILYNGCAISQGGPYFYQNETTSGREREILELSREQGSQVQGLLKELQKLEKDSYNWDEVKCALYGDGSHSVERKFFSFSDGLSSFPVNSIKTIDLHAGWLPVIKDFGGNFIGIDFDPDTNGTKGQVIVYGRDEMEMFVLANSWGEFLDLVIGIIESKPDSLLESTHLHDYFKEQIGVE